MLVLLEMLQGRKRKKEGNRWKAKLPEGSDRGKIAGGDHDAEGGGREHKLRKAQREAAGRPRHALYVLHPHTERVLGRIREGRSLHGVYRRPAREHLPRSFYSSIISS